MSRLNRTVRAFSLLACAAVVLPARAEGTDAPPMDPEMAKCFADALKLPGFKKAGAELRYSTRSVAMETREGEKYFAVVLPSTDKFQMSINLHIYNRNSGRDDFTPTDGIIQLKGANGQVDERVDATRLNPELEPDQRDEIIQKFALFAAALGDCNVAPYRMSRDKLAAIFGQEYIPD